VSKNEGKIVVKMKLEEAVWGGEPTDVAQKKKEGNSQVQKTVDAPRRRVYARTITTKWSQL